MAKRLTLVTAFFDLGRREQNSTRRQASEYLIHAEKVLALDVDLVIFADQEFVHPIWSRRRHYGLLKRTMIVGFALESSPYYRYKLFVEDFLRCRVNTERFFTKGKHTSLYTIVTWTKFYLLQQIAEENPFNGTHIGWIDFGLAHVVNFSDIDRVLANPADKIRLLIIRFAGKAEIKDRERWCTQITSIVTGGGFFTGTNDRMIVLAKLFAREVEKIIRRGYSNFEEEILPVLYTRYPEMFEFYYGHYGSLINNYHHLRIEAHRVVTNIKHCIAADLHHYAVQIGDMSWRDYKAGYFEADLREILLILDNYIIGLFYRDKRAVRCDQFPEIDDHDRAREAIQMYLNLINKNPQLRGEFLNPRVVQNFSLLGISP